jgi:hypothetical protein
MLENDNFIIIPLSLPVTTLSQEERYIGCDKKKPKTRGFAHRFWALSQVSQAFRVKTLNHPFPPPFLILRLKNL